MSLPITCDRKACSSLAAAAALILPLVVGGRVAAASSPDAAGPPTYLCAEDTQAHQHMLRTGPLLEYFIATYKSTLTPQQLAELLSKPFSSDDPEVVAHPEVLDIASETLKLLSRPASKQFKPEAQISVANYYLYYLGNSDPQRGPLSKGGSSYPIVCLVPATPTEAAQQAGLRLRGTPDDLSISKTDTGYSGASKATLNVSDDQATKVTTTQIQGAVGYAIPTDPNAQNVVTPYVAGDYNGSQTKGKPNKLSADYIDFGIQDTALINLGIGEATLSFAPDYLHNYISGASVVSAQPIFAPIIYKGINRPYSLSELLMKTIGTGLPASDTTSAAGATYVTLLFDVRGDFGTFTNCGIPSAQAGNQDYARVGSKFGIDIAKKNWFEFTLADVQLYGPIGVQRHVSDLELSLTFYPGNQNVLGLALGYKSGLIEESLQKEQIWSIGLTAKY